MRLKQLPVALVLLTLSCSNAAHPSASPRTPTPSTGSPSATGAADGLSGTWQTAYLPTAAWVATYRLGGSTPAQLRAYTQELRGFGRVHSYSINIMQGQWVEFESHDHGPASVGWKGSYVRNGPTVVATETGTGCVVTYRLTLTSDTLRITVLKDTPERPPDCGQFDLPPQRSIYSTAPFQRVSG